jgi:Domain of unknown function (DUF4113)
VFVTTNRSQAEHFSNSATVSLPIATSDTAELLHYALRAAESLYRSILPFKKAGVIMLELTPITQQLAFWDDRNRDRQQQLIHTLDLINARFGAGTLCFAVAGLRKPWQMKATRKSPRCTTFACGDSLTMICLHQRLGNVHFFGVRSVKAGVTLEVSNGQVEGQNNRLKMLKRQMYG